MIQVSWNLDNYIGVAAILALVSTCWHANILSSEVICSSRCVLSGLRKTQEEHTGAMVRNI
jgi:hypothetical protein